jgi:uncharacterized membrane protein YqiK
MLLVGLGVIVAVMILLGIYKEMWRAAKPDEALIISGLGAKTHNRDTAVSLGFKITTGKGAMVLPGFQTCRRFSLAARATEVKVTCETSDGTKVRVHGVVGYRVGDDVLSIATAARRFLDQQTLMDTQTRKLFAGRLSSIVRKLTVEDLPRDGDRLADRVRASFADTMSKLGLVVDSLKIQDIEHDVH